MQGQSAKKRLPTGLFAPDVVMGALALGVLR
jgi:hypothetical protein